MDELVKGLEALEGVKNLSFLGFLFILRIWFLLPLIKELDKFQGTYQAQVESRKTLNQNVERLEATLQVAIQAFTQIFKPER